MVKYSFNIGEASMHNVFTRDRSPSAQIVQQLSIKAQQLISLHLDYGLVEEAKELQQIENELISLISNRKEKHQTTHYIWHTQGDDKVRPSHAANNGRIFSWINPPSTGNPGEDFGCRCWAEAIKVKEYVQQILVPLDSDSEKWTTSDFLKHFYFGEGRIVTLPESGHLSGIVDYYFYQIYREGNNTYDRLNNQIINAARAQGAGNLRYDFNNSYTEFGDYFWVFGGGTVKGGFNGTVKTEKGVMYIEGDIDYRYIDTFTDPADIRQLIINGTSEPLDAGIINLLFTDALGHYFDIVGTWQSTFQAQIKIDPEDSAY